MSTYAMSDLHGCFDEFQEMLGKIGFYGPDRLVVAGDLIERGPKTYEMLRWMEKCPENVVLLMGNHEHEFAGNIAVMEYVCGQAGRDPDSVEDTILIFNSIKKMESGFFDYYGSIANLIREHKVTLKELAGWSEMIRKLPCTYETVMHGRRFIVVHAGYTEDLEALPARDSYSSMEDFFLYAREDAYLYGGAPHATIIAGHTPTIIRSRFSYSAGRVYRYYNSKKDCTFYDIDCGAVFRGRGTREANMACIRLEDEEITYLY